MPKTTKAQEKISNRTAKIQSCGHQAAREIIEITAAIWQIQNVAQLGGPMTPDCGDFYRDAQRRVRKLKAIIDEIGKRLPRRHPEPEIISRNFDLTA